jgi:hypothetical protein
MTAAVIIRMLLSMDNVFESNSFCSSYFLCTLEDSDCAGNKEIIE